MGLYCSKTATSLCRCGFILCTFRRFNFFYASIGAVFRCTGKPFCLEPMFKILPLLLLSLPGFAATPALTAVFNSRRNCVELEWRNEQAGTGAFTVQRSDNNKTWADIAMQQVNTAAVNRSFYFNDTRPVAGENYYRLKVTKADGTVEYSGTVMVIIGAPGKSWVMFPVPVTDMLTLQYRGSGVIRGVINVFIQTMSGKILYRLRAASSNTTIKIPVDNLGKGIYDIRVIVENEVMWNQRFVK